MFNFAIKKTSVKAQESLAEVKPEVRGYKAVNLSEGGRQAVLTGCIRGIISSMAKLLRLRGDKQNVVAEKIKPFVASCVAGGDLSKEDAEWILSDDWYFSAWDYIPYCSSTHDSLYSLFYSIMEDAKCSKLWNSEAKDWYNAKINEDEKAILDAYNKAEQAYYEARKIRDEYFTKRGALIVHDVLRKYASHLSSIDQEFYNFMAERVAETLSQLDDDNSCPSDPSIKAELAKIRGVLTDDSLSSESEVDA